jgi:hypothetical protein
MEICLISTPPSLLFFNFLRKIDNSLNMCYEFVYYLSQRFPTFFLSRTPLLGFSFMSTPSLHYPRPALKTFFFNYYFSRFRNRSAAYSQVYAFHRLGTTAVSHSLVSIKWLYIFYYYFFILIGGVRLSSLSMSATIYPTVRALSDG